MFNQDKCSGSRRYHKACHKCRSCGKLLAPGKAHLHNKEPYCRLVWGKHLHFGAHWLMRKHVPIFIASEKTNTIELKPMLQDLPCSNYPATNTIEQIEQMLQDLLRSNHAALLTCALPWHDHHQVRVHFEHFGHLEQIGTSLVSWTFLTCEHLEPFGFFEHHGHLEHLDHFEILWSLGVATSSKLWSLLKGSWWRGLP